MNTATQLLERVKAVMSMTDLEDIGLYDEIEAYLAKQQVEQEPVAWVNLADNFYPCDRVVMLNKDAAENYSNNCYALTPVYTSPQAREPMSEDELYRLCFEYRNAAPIDAHDWWVEIKNLCGIK
jgi:hypothetical protein